MPQVEFERWAAERLAKVEGDRAAFATEQKAVDADRKLRAWAREEGQRQREEQRARLTRPVGPSESPLEEALLQAFLRVGFQRARALSDIVVGQGPLGLLLQQLPVTTPAAKYRLDFALIRPLDGVFLAIEVDGRNFHDRTLEQARLDRQRDRRLTAAGWTVIRFSGSDVHRNADGCVHEVCELAASDRAPRAQPGKDKQSHG
ncbi:MAG: DUF559 domain-containing protein [Myxococcota bacterium]